MKIAFTADNHLTSRSQNPERFATLELILADMQSLGIATLVIAGDLFDASRQDYLDFERLCSKDEYQELSILVIPGNHDPSIDNRKIVVDIVEIITEPAIREIGGRQFIFLPYELRKTMGELIAHFSADLDMDKWVLVGHGDWAEGLRTPNPYEPGIYMPLTRKDIEVYRPAFVFLGHIHKAIDTPPVHYIGSPCGLDVSETGRRRFLVFDTETSQIEKRKLVPPILYFDETFVVLPVEDEDAQLRRQIQKRKKSWGLNPEEEAKAQIRIGAAGYSADRAAIQDVLQEEFEGYKYYKDQKPDIEEVKISEDVEKNFIAEELSASIEVLDWSRDEDDPTLEEVLLEALGIVYGR